MIHFRMNSYSLLALPILGMEICWFISKHNDFSYIYPVMITTISVTTRSNISSWMIPCIDMGLTLFSGDASLMRRLNMCWMIATMEHVEVIYLEFLQPKKSFVLAIFGLLSSKTVMRLLRNAHIANIFIPKSAPILLRFTSPLSLALFPNGGLTSCIVSLP